MKRIIFTSVFFFFILCFSPVRLVAQTSRGDQLFGVMATLGRPYPPYTFYKAGRYDLYYQRFLVNRFSLGVNANYSYTYGFYDTHFNSFGAGIEGRYYFLKSTYKFQPYVFGGLETNWSRTVYPEEALPFSWLGIQANTGAGFDWYLRPNFALNARAGINFRNIQTGKPSADFNFKVGVTFKIPHKEKK